MDRAAGSGHHNEIVDQLVAGIAHELNNSLAIISANTSMLRDRGRQGEEVFDCFTAIDEAVADASKLCRSLLAVSQRRPGTKEPVNLTAVVEQAGRLLERLLPLDVSLSVDVPARQQPWVRADPVALQQGVLSLALQARDALANGGEIKISVSLEAARRASADGSASAADRPVSATICVGHWALEIDGNDGSHASRSASTSEPKGPTASSSLYELRGIVRDHGGRLASRSERDGGSITTIELPCIEAAPAPLTATPAAIQPVGRGETILLAEDDARIRAFMAGALVSFGYEVIQTCDGEALLDQFRQRGQDVKLLIIDLNLPRRTGLECLEVMREAGAAVPAILVTGDTEVEINAQEYGDVVLLTKPFRLAEMGQLVRKMLGSGIRDSGPDDS